MTYLHLKNSRGEIRYLMRLKVFTWHNPSTEQPEIVYEFPYTEATGLEIGTYGRDMYSSRPMERPLLFILPNFLTELKKLRHTVQPVAHETKTYLFEPCDLEKDQNKRQAMMQQSQL